MPEIFVFFIVGAVCIVIGIFNWKGNISTIHSYHRRRVSEQDRLPFGRMMGLGTILIGAAMVICGIFTALAQLWALPLLSVVGSVIMIIGLVAGVGLSFYAMIKYNKGIF